MDDGERRYDTSLSMPPSAAAPTPRSSQRREFAAVLALAACLGFAQLTPRVLAHLERGRSLALQAIDLPIGGREWLGLGLMLHAIALFLLLPSLARRQWQIPRRLAVGVLGVGVGFGAAVQVADAATPPQGGDLLTAKLRRWNERDDWQAIYIGSSRAWRHFVPQVFAETFKQAGSELKGFNLGIPDMRNLEALTLLRRLLADPPPDLRWIVLDAEDDSLGGEAENRLSTRSILWHEPANLTRILTEVRGEQWTPAKWAAARDPILATLRNASGVGLAVEWLAQERQPIWNAHLLEDGYLSLEDELAAAPDWRVDELVARRRLLVDHLPRYRRQVAALLNRPPPGSPRDKALNARAASSFEMQILEDIDRLAAAHQIRVLHVVDARLMPKSSVVAAHQAGRIRELIRFDDPRRFDEFYDPAQRYDRHHLAKGPAREFSRQVARHLIQLEEAPAP